MIPGKVFLVGAGPGDPGLLTVRARELLTVADFVLYDQLISPEVLRLIPKAAEVQAVETLPGKHPDRFHAIYARMIEKARAGKSVVRLKSGDPMIFGRVGEETEALRQADISYEIIPGVTAALAAGAYLEIPLTHRLHSSLLTIVTGHECKAKGNSSLDWANLATNRGTLAFYMGVSRLKFIADNLISHGKSADTPAAVIHRATWNRQKSVTATLGSIHEAVVAAGLEAPSILVVGPVVGLKGADGWFEAKPLLGLRVLVTRPANQAEELGRLLKDQGAEPVYCPLVEIAPPASFTSLDALIHQLNLSVNPQRSWLVFTSVNGVEAFLNRLFELRYDLRTLGRANLAAIGQRTSLALEKRGLRSDCTASEDSNSEALIKILKEKVVGQSVFLCQAEEGRELLFEELGKLTQVKKIPVYRQLPANVDFPDSFEFDVVTLTSPQLARLFLERCGEAIRTRIQSGSVSVATNSKRTTELIEKAGLPVNFESAQPDMENLVKAICDGRAT